MKRPLTSTSFQRRVQAIGSTLVAVLTKSRAVMNAAAKAVAVSRPGVKIVDIFKSLLFVGPTIGPRILQCRERAKLKLYNDFNVRERRTLKI